MGCHRGVRKEGTFLPLGQKAAAGGCPDSQPGSGCPGRLRAAALSAPAPGRRLRAAPAARATAGGRRGRGGLPREGKGCWRPRRPGRPAPRLLPGLARSPPQRPPSPRPGPRRPGPERAASRLDSSLLGRRGLKRPQRSDGQPLPRVRGTLGWPGPRWVPAGSSAPLEGWRCPAEPGWRWGREESARGRSSSPSGAAPPPPKKKGNRPMLTNGSLGAAPQALGDLDAASPFLVCGEPVAEQQHAAGERKR